MRSAKIVTDSAASIPSTLAARWHISVVPVGIQLNNEIFRENVDMEPETFYERFDDAESLTTSQPSPGDFLEVYEEAVKDNLPILSIHIAGASSGTVQAAQIAAREMDAQIQIIDTESCSMGQGFLVLAAAQWAEQGVAPAEIVRRVEEAKQEALVWVAVPTLKYLARSGKVSRVKAAVANVLKIKPILSMIDGLAQVVGQARSYPKALERVLEMAERKVGTRPMQAAILHTYCPQEAQDFAHRVADRIRCTSVITAEMGAALAVHGGQGMLGLALFPSDKVEQA